MTFDEFKEGPLTGTLWIVFVLLTAPIWIALLVVVLLLDLVDLAVDDWKNRHE